MEFSDHHLSFPFFQGDIISFDITSSFFFLFFFYFARERRGSLGSAYTHNALGLSTDNAKENENTVPFNDD